MSRSPEGQSYQHLYKTPRWRKRRARQLAKHPWCQCPHCREGKGAWTEATVVDHIVRHNGDRKLFFDPRNVQSMSASCHNSRKQSQERGGSGFLSGCDERGEPLSREHHWYGGDGND